MALRTRYEQFVEKHVIPPLSKIGSQRHMVVIREAFLSIIPLVLVGAIFLVLPNLPGLMDILAPYRTYFNYPYQITFGIISLYLAICIAYNLAGTYNIDQLMVGITSAMVFLLSIIELEEINGVPYLSIQWIGSWGIFGALILSIYTVEVFRLCMQKGVYFKAPRGIPPGVTRFIQATLPMIIIIMPIWVIRSVGIRVPTLLADAMRPLIVLADTYPAFLTALFIEHLTWYVGVHSWALIGPLYFPFLVSNQLANADLIAKGLAPIYIATFNTYFGGAGGGTGNHFMLAVFGLRSKSKTLRAVSKAGILSTFLNINEPILFGFPVILNPIYFIPHCILAPLIRSLTYVLTYMGLVEKCYIMFFAFVPGPFLWYPCNLDPRILLWGILISYILPAIAYYPFFKIHERVMLSMEAAQEKTLAS